MKKNKPSIRRSVVVVDDHPIMRQGIAQLINHEPDLIVQAEAETAGEAFNIVTKQKPDLLLLDISLPDKSGLELIKDVHAFAPELPILVLSMHDEALYAERVLRAGGRGYVMKQEGGKKLMDAIRQVLSGQVAVSGKMSARILEIFSGGRSTAPASSVESLSDREFEVFQLIGRGMGTKQIADHLHLSTKTVEVHRVNIKEKLGIATVGELIHYAVRWCESQHQSG